MHESPGSAVKYWIDPLEGDEDLDGVLAVEEESFTNPWTKEMYAWELQNRSVCHIYVVRTPEQRVAGFCAFWLVVDEIHINNLAIRPALRGQGIGTQLIRRVFDEAKRLGARRATLEVRRSNAERTATRRTPNVQRRTERTAKNAEERVRGSISPLAVQAAARRRGAGASRPFLSRLYLFSSY